MTLLLQKISKIDYKIYIKMFKFSKNNFSFKTFINNMPIYRFI